MGFWDWLFRRPQPTPAKVEMVPFLDVANRRVVQIPAAELRPGAIQVRVQGVEGADDYVWALPEQLTPSAPQHPPFGEELLAPVRRIQSVFAEHRPLSLEEWEDGFRRDWDPESEIAIWLFAADIYEQFAKNDPSPQRRLDFYRTIVTCLTTSPDDVWKVLRPSAISREEAQQMIDLYFGSR